MLPNVSFVSFVIGLNLISPIFLFNSNKYLAILQLKTACGGIMIIGVISDTHVTDRVRELPKDVFEHFSDVDLIIHCGDVTSPNVLDSLKDISNVVAVKGNMDYMDLPEKEILNIENFKIGVMHGDVIYPRGDLLKMKYTSMEMGLDVLITGHTHVPLVKEVENKILLLNPGSPTVPRYPLKTIMKLKIENNNIKANLIPLNEK